MVHLIKSHAIILSCLYDLLFACLYGFAIFTSSQAIKLAREKHQNMKTIETSDESIKSLIEKITALPEWQYPATSQKTIKLAACLWILDAAEVAKGEKRDAVIKAFMATSSGFGCNTPQLVPALGLREKATAKKEMALSGL